MTLSFVYLVAVLGVTLILELPLLASKRRGARILAVIIALAGTTGAAASVVHMRQQEYDTRKALGQLTEEEQAVEAQREERARAAEIEAGRRPWSRSAAAKRR